MGDGDVGGEFGGGVGVADLLDELQLEKPAPAEFKPTEAGDLLDEILGAKPQPKAEAGAATALDDLFAELETKAEAKSAGIQDEIFQSFVSHLDQETVTAKDAHTHFDLGIAFREMDSIEEALAEFEKALAMDTGDLTFDINYQLGQCYGSLNKPEMAIEYLETALAEGSENESVLWDLLFELGVAHKKLGNPERAKQYFVEVDKKSSNYRGAKTEIADLEKTKGKKGKKKGEPDDDNIGFL